MKENRNMWEYNNNMNTKGHVVGSDLTSTNPWPPSPPPSLLSSGNDHPHRPLHPHNPQRWDLREQRNTIISPNPLFVTCSLPELNTTKK